MSDMLWGAEKRYIDVFEEKAFKLSTARWWQISRWRRDKRSFLWRGSGISKVLSRWKCTLCTQGLDQRSIYGEPPVFKALLQGQKTQWWTTEEKPCQPEGTVVFSLHLKIEWSRKVLLRSRVWSDIWRSEGVSQSHTWGRVFQVEGAPWPRPWGCMA